MKVASLFASILFGSITLLTSLVSGQDYKSMTVSVGMLAQCPPSQDAQDALNEYASLAMTQFEAYCNNNVINQNPIDLDCESFVDRRRQLGEAELEPLDRPYNRELQNGCPCCRQNSVYCGQKCAVMNCRRRLEEGTVTMNDSRQLGCISDVQVCKRLGTLQDATTNDPPHVTDKIYPVTQNITDLNCANLDKMRLMYCPGSTNLTSLQNPPGTEGGMSQSDYLDLCEANPSDINCVDSIADCTIGNRNNKVRCCRVFENAPGCPYCDNTIVNANRCRARGWCCQKNANHPNGNAAVCPSDPFDFPDAYPQRCIDFINAE